MFTSFPSDFLNVVTMSAALNKSTIFRPVHKPQLLLAEENLSQATYFKYYFEKLGYRVTTASNSEQVLNLLDQQLWAGGGSPRLLPSVIILGLKSTQMDSIAICRKIKRKAPFCRIPTVILSDEPSLEQKVLAYQIGADYYLENGPETVNLLESLIKARLEVSSVR